LHENFCAALPNTLDGLRIRDADFAQAAGWRRRGRLLLPAGREHDHAERHQQKFSHGFFLKNRMLLNGRIGELIYHPRRAMSSGIIPEFAQRLENKKAGDFPALWKTIETEMTKSI
jgi:hypothetical protein